MTHPALSYERFALSGCETDHRIAPASTKASKIKQEGLDQ